MDFWTDVLGAPTKIVAPMVDASELAWRLLSRRYGAELCYTPMLHSSIFCKDSKYRKEGLASCSEDKPLIVQFCGNDPQTMLQAALLAQDHCSAIDINLGCPQAIAKRGNYGAFLQDKWDLIYEIVSTLSKSASVPITCKVRIFEDMDKTIKYAKMLESAGCSVLTVHGRTREQKGPLTGIANWNYVKAVKEAVKIPVISNGNIQCMQDLTRCLDETKVNGVMTAEGNLYNPAIFVCQYPAAWEPALEYMDLVDKYPCPTSYVRGHLFKLFHHLLSIPSNNHLRIRMGSANNLKDLKEIVLELKNVYLPYHEGKLQWTENTEIGTQNLILPPWCCQSYVRTTPEEHLRKVEGHKIINENKSVEQTNKRQYMSTDGTPISRKKMKKLRRVSRRPDKPDGIQNQRSLEKCSTCVNPLVSWNRITLSSNCSDSHKRGSKCEYKLCKKCCKDKCFVENLDCSGHRILVKTRRAMAKSFNEKEKTEISTT